jgi:hypothetical protein
MASFNDNSINEDIDNLCLDDLFYEKQYESTIGFSNLKEKKTLFYSMVTITTGNVIIKMGLLYLNADKSMTKKSVQVLLL